MYLLPGPPGWMRKEKKKVAKQKKTQPDDYVTKGKDSDQATSSLLTVHAESLPV